jgi:N-acetylglucosaminyl-diphospho-decaprenol L-rhamnosyltransferase
VTRVAVITLVAGRHRHLEEQQRSLSRSTRLPEVVVVESMGDPHVSGVVRQGPLARLPRLEVVIDEFARVGSALPLAAARNRGAARALESGADLLIFLDVDCLPSRELVSRYVQAVSDVPGTAPRLWAGPVAYLPPPSEPSQRYSERSLSAARPHPARPAPPPGTVEKATDLRLFWSLSFALRASDWKSIGGFDEGYVGYGGEDTDFAQRAGSVGTSLWWVGGATAYHQWHPVSDPPVEHLADILRNANRFQARWGWFPMEGWLTEFQARGFAHLDTARRQWVVGPPGRSRAV